MYIVNCFVDSSDNVSRIRNYTFLLFCLVLTASRYSANIQVSVTFSLLLKFPKDLSKFSKLSTLYLEHHIWNIYTMALSAQMYILFFWLLLLATHSIYYDITRRPLFLSSSSNVTGDIYSYMFGF